MVHPYTLLAKYLLIFTSRFNGLLKLQENRGFMNHECKRYKFFSEDETERRVEYRKNNARSEKSLHYN